MVGAGTRHKRIVLWLPSVTPDGEGGGTEELTLALSARALVETLTEREVFRNRQAHDESTHRFTIPYRRGITTRHIIFMGERRFRITSAVNTDEANEELVLLGIEEPRA